MSAELTRGTLPGATVQAPPGEARGTAYVRISGGPYVAQIAPNGAALAELTFRGEHIVVPVAEGDIATAYQGKTLAPWPNRLHGATYRAHGERHHLPVTEPTTGAALHGLVSWQDFAVISTSESSVRLVTRVLPQSGYPFTIRILVTYTLAEDGLQVTTSVVNQGELRAPFGVGAHPYLRCGTAALGACEITLPPTCRPALGAFDDELDIATALAARGVPVRVGDSRVDHAFTALPDVWAVSLSDPNTGLWVRLASRSAWMQIYTGDVLNRAGLAVEPMSCPPNAFNTGLDLVWLLPGGSHVFGWSLDAGVG